MDTAFTLLLLIFSTFFVSSLVGMIVIAHKVYEISKDLQLDDEHNKRLSRKLSRTIEEKADEQISKVLTSFGQKLEKEIKEHLIKLADDAQLQSEQMAKFIQDQQSAIARESQFLVANSLQKITKQLEGYQKNRIAEVDDQVRQIILSASREVLGRSISLSEHEKLVREAIERAKKDKLFS